MSEYEQMTVEQLVRVGKGKGLTCTWPDGSDMEQVRVELILAIKDADFWKDMHDRFC